LPLPRWIASLTFVTRNREFGRLFVREMAFPGENTQLASRDLDMRYLNKLEDVLGRAQERGELSKESDLILLIGHLHALYILVLSSFYRGDVTSLEDAETFAHALVLQALHGPAAMAQAKVAVRQNWDDLKQQFLDQRTLEL
jgi:hypothetical protein